MKVGFISNNTVNFISNSYKKVSGNKDIIVGGYNQYVFDLSSPDSELHKFDPEFIVVNLDGEELLNMGDSAHIKDHLLFLLNNINMNFGNSYVLFTNIYFHNRINAMDNYNKDLSTKGMQLEINLFLEKLALENDKIFIVDTLSIIEEYGSQNIFNNSTWVFANLRYNKLGHTLVATRIHQTINYILNKTAKCLVLDLDNTMWGGVIGEDGINGLTLSSEKMGLVYKNLQKEIKKIQNKGILLALCSKNNMEDAKEVFDHHKDMQFSWDDFIIHKVNWNLKDRNIKEIAQELNIGEDSLVFIDDNPMERDLVKNNTQAIVPDFPAHPENLLDFISKVDTQHFCKYSLSQEDTNKTEQYKQNQQRNTAQSSFDNYDDYIKSLHIELEIFKDNKDQLVRISQLTQKTNQFNFTTKRYSEQDILHFIDSNEHTVYTGSVKDKFGEYGIVIVAIVCKINDRSYHIDTLLMSCRVIGKQVENGFLTFIANDLKQNITISYLPTKKNILVKDKMPELGFTLTTEQNNSKNYTLSTDNTIVFNNNITIKPTI